MKTADQRGVRLLVIGSEVTQGFVRDSNTQFLTSEMFSLGVKMKEVRTIPDDLQIIVGTLKAFIKTGDFIITTGGLGPTDDDLTVNALCRLFKVDAIYVETCMKRIRKYILGKKKQRGKKRTAE